MSMKALNAEINRLGGMVTDQQREIARLKRENEGMRAVLRSEGLDPDIAAAMPGISPLQSSGGPK